MPGSGINKNNLSELIQKTKEIEYHSSTKTIDNNKMNYFNQEISMGGIYTVNEFTKIAVDPGKVKKMYKIITSNTIIEISSLSGGEINNVSLEIFLYI